MDFFQNMLTHCASFVRNMDRDNKESNVEIAMCFNVGLIASRDPHILFIVTFIAS